MKALGGRVLGVALVAGALTAANYGYAAYENQVDEKNMLAKEVKLQQARATQLRYEMYEKDSREPLRGKPLVVSLINQAIVIEGLDWDEEQIEAMASICWRESRYNPNSQNPTSTAYGLYQFLDSTWQYYGVKKTADPLLQTVAAIRYVEDRYQTPKEALAYHKKLHLINGELVHYY